MVVQKILLFLLNSFIICYSIAYSFTIFSLKIILSLYCSLFKLGVLKVNNISRFMLEICNLTEFSFECNKSLEAFVQVQFTYSYNDPKLTMIFCAHSKLENYSWNFKKT